MIRDAFSRLLLLNVTIDEGARNSIILCNITIYYTTITMKGTKVQTLGGRAVAGAWLVAWAIMAMGAIINTHAHR